MSSRIPPPGGVVLRSFPYLSFHRPFLSRQKFQPYRYRVALVACINMQQQGNQGFGNEGGNRKKFRWAEVGGPDVTPQQKEAIFQLPFKMTKRCKAVMRQIICYSPDKGGFPDLLSEWVRVMKPARCDWLAVIKQLKTMNYPLHLQVLKFALLEESFEANMRDYTKLMHAYGKQNQLQDAESILLAMKKRGFVCDQVVLTTMVDMYSKAGDLKLAKEMFEEIKLLGIPVDKRSYGAMIMAYIRAGMPEMGEVLLKEMDEHQIKGGSEIYKALLRAYSMAANSEGAQRVFDAIQLAGIIPDARICGLLVNAYATAGRTEKAVAALENMRRAGLEPNDKCVAVILEVYERENKIIKALDFILKLERDGVVLGKEASGSLARWLRRLGVVE